MVEFPNGKSWGIGSKDDPRSTKWCDALITCWTGSKQIMTQYYRVKYIHSPSIGSSRGLQMISQAKKPPWGWRKPPSLINFKFFNPEKLPVAEDQSLPHAGSSTRSVWAARAFLECLWSAGISSWNPVFSVDCWSVAYNHIGGSWNGGTLFHHPL